MGPDLKGEGGGECVSLREHGCFGLRRERQPQRVEAGN